MPHGMGFTIPGWNLDIAERGLDKKLVLERNMGLMISGRDIGFGNYAKVNGYEMGHERAWKGFGYDIMIANQAGRSAAVTNAKEGNGNSYAARVMFDYTSFDIGVDSHFYNGANVKAEYIEGHNIKGQKDVDETALSFTAQYAINNTFEPTIKHIQATSIKGTGATQTKLGNSYLGLNIYLNPFDAKMDRNSKRKRNAHKLVLNYIIASGDTADATTPWSGLGGYKDSAWIFQYQVGF